NGTRTPLKRVRGNMGPSATILTEGKGDGTPTGGWSAWSASTYT
ncbi:hypothetical protein A2U01_0009711, partial [Trifolium medium]|nr:hypothetical protein [Trifolium medium]